MTKGHDRTQGGNKASLSILLLPSLWCQYQLAKQAALLLPLVSFRSCDVSAGDRDGYPHASHAREYG